MEKYKFKAKTFEGKKVIGYYVYNPSNKEHKIVTYQEEILLGISQAMYGDKKNKKRYSQTTYIINPKTLIQLQKCKNCKKWVESKQLIKNKCIFCEKQ